MISEQVDATVDRFIGVVSLSAACGRLFSFRPKLGLAVGAQHAPLRDDLPAEYARVVHHHITSTALIDRARRRKIVGNFYIAIHL